MSNPIVEQCLRQKLNNIQTAAGQLPQEREKLWTNERMVRDQIHEAILSQTNELRAREEQLLIELSAKMKDEEMKIQRKQEGLVEAMTAYQQALNSIHNGNGQQINEAMLKLNNLNLEPIECDQLKFEANQTQCQSVIRFLGQIKASNDKASFSWARPYGRSLLNDEMSMSDDDFEIVNETDSTTIEPSSLDSMREVQRQPIESSNPTFQEHVQKIMDSPAQKWLLNAGAQSCQIERKPPKFNVQKTQKHKMECQKKSPKTSQSFDEVIRSIQRSPNNKWLREFQASCPEVVQNVATVFERLMNERVRDESIMQSKWLRHSATVLHPTPLIMHHV